jgi:hypothetical protein
MNQTARPDRSSPAWKAVPWAVAILAILFAFWWGRERPGDTSSEGPVVPSVVEEPGQPPPIVEADTGPEAARQRWKEVTGSEPIWPQPFAEPSDCEAVLANLRALCAELDTRDYVRAHRYEGGVCGFLARVSRDLENEPPPIHGELRELLDVRHSVAHLYRALGETRVLQLAEMVALEPDLAEPMAMALFRWGAVKDRCEPAAMGPKSQYTYATWLLRTVGGQAYLRRRSPRHEALVTFYAIAVLDRSIARGYDPAGVDLGHDLARCRDMIAMREDLVFRDRYLSYLREMEDRWNRRTGQVRS